MNDWYRACADTASILRNSIPEVYRSRTFSGIIGDIKALTPEKAFSLISRKKGLGLQYAYLYLSQGIDGGRGYQACAVEALNSVLGAARHIYISENVLDVGCAVGVTAGVLGLKRVTGFDLFPDLLRAAQMVDSFTGSGNRYISADMTRTWPFDSEFDTVICGMVCHHLKVQANVTTFFSNANRVLKTDGFLIITLPSGSVSTASQLENLVHAVESFGFMVDRKLSGMVVSTDNPHTLFWMFIIIGKKKSEEKKHVFVNPGFGFSDYRTPVTRKEKSNQARQTAAGVRQVKHECFTLINVEDLKILCGETILIYPDILSLVK